MNRRSHVVFALLLGSLSAGRCEAQSTLLFNPSNGHHYVRFDSPLDWFAAQAAATTSTLGGVNGYLATITSSEENSLIAAAFPSGGHWLGGFQPSGSVEPGGGWEWVTGEPWSFTAWGGSEPNNAFGTEDGLNSHGNGQWNDATRTGAGPYLVEYPTSGALFRWANAGGGDIDTAANWSSNYLPVATDPAIFDLGTAGYTVTATQNRSLSQLSVGTDNVTLDLGASTLDITGTQGQVLRVADGSGDAGVLRITSGTVATRGLGVATTDGLLGTTGFLEIIGPTARLEILGTDIDENQIGGGGNDVGSVNAQNGATIHAPTIDISLGRNGGTGRLHLDGVGTRFESFRLFVGLLGTGEFEIENQATAVIHRFFSIANQGSNPAGSAVVKTGASLTVNGRIDVGRSGDGTLLIEAGGIVQSMGLSSTNPDIDLVSGIVGATSGGAVVRGTTSKWTNNGVLVIGLGGQGRLQVENGGEVVATRSRIGSLATGSGVVQVVDAGSHWDIVQDLTVGGNDVAQGGQGLLEVKSGGRVDVGTTLRIWESGVVDVSNTGSINIGQVDFEAAPGTVQLAENAFLRGGGTVKGNVDVVGNAFAQARAYVAPGNGDGTTGRLTIDGDYHQFSWGVLQVDLAGPQPGAQYDQLFVTGHATFSNGSRFQISLAGGFTPVVGDIFKIVDWGNRSGTFSVGLPLLPSGMGWDTRELNTSGVLKVAVAQQTIAGWTFEAGTLGNPPSASGTTLSGISPATGNGVASGSHASAATVWDNPAGNGSLESMSSNNWAVGDFYQFRVSTIGLEDITLGFEQVSSTSGPRDFQLQYSTDGSSFVDFGAPYAVRANANPGWSTLSASGLDTFSFDLSTLSSINNQANLYLRLVVDSNISSVGAISTGGTSRLDNVTVSGTKIIGLAGDFNDDGIVDGGDFLVWQRQLGGSVVAYSGADGDGNGIVNAADFTIWRDRFGNSLSSSAAISAAVPEPDAAVLILGCIAVAVESRRSRPRRLDHRSEPIARSRGTK